MVEITPNPYNDQEYQQHRETWLGIIPKSNFLSAIGRNAGTIYSALAMSAVAAIVSGVLHVPVWGVVGLIGGALVAAGVSAYAGYKDETLSKTTNLDYNEARQVADARVNARELAGALKDTLGAELKDIKKENYQTQQAMAQTQSVVAHLQKQMLTWQEREAGKEETPRVLQ